MASFLNSAGKRATDIRSFVKEASGNSGLRYRPEAGKRHHIYIPYVMGQEDDGSGTMVVKKQLIAMWGKTHEWNGNDSRYRSCICLKDVVRKAPDGEMFLNDGSCPFCDAVNEGWEIRNYRRDLEVANCGKSGKDLTEFTEKISSELSNERKAKDARPYIYVLVAQFNTTNTGDPVMGADNTPEYELKLMKLSESRVQKIEQQVKNAGSEIEGNEMIFEYPNETDPRLVVSGSSTTPVFPAKQFVPKYAGLAEKIQNAAAKFEFDGIEKSFSEWEGMTTAQAQKEVQDLFEAWREFKKELAVNPNAKYLEYKTADSKSNPSIAPTAAIAGTVQGITPTAAPVMPGAAGFQMPGAFASAPTAAPAMAAPAAAPVIGGIPNISDVLGGTSGPVRL